MQAANQTREAIRNLRKEVSFHVKVIPLFCIAQPLLRIT